MGLGEEYLSASASVRISTAKLPEKISKRAFFKIGINLVSITSFLNLVGVARMHLLSLMSTQRQSANHASIAVEVRSFFIISRTLLHISVADFIYLNPFRSSGEIHIVPN